MLTAPTTPAAAAAAWWHDAGVDVIVGDIAVNWLAPARAAPAARPPAPARPAPAAAAAPAASADFARAESLAASADSPAALAAAFRDIGGPAATLYEGDPAADLFFILDAPATAGQPGLLGGDPARLFDAMLKSIDRKRETVCLVSVAPAPGLAATQPPMTIAFCRRLAELAPAAVVVSLGADATALLLGARSGVGRLRGRFTDWAVGARTLPLLPTFHPAFLLAQPAQKAAAWADLRQVRARLAR